MPRSGTALRVVMLALALASWLPGRASAANPAAKACHLACRADAKTCRAEELGDVRACGKRTRQCRKACRAQWSRSVASAVTPVCGNGIVEAGETCDGGVCCSSTCQLMPVGTVCGDKTGNDCTLPDTCNASGVCAPNNMAAGTIAPTFCADNNPCTADQCNGTGGCQHPLLPSGTLCGSIVGNDCSLPDRCNTTGQCLTNDMAAGTIAPTLCNDGNPCTRDLCNGSGGCQNPFSAPGALCGDMRSDDCNGPDQCNGTGTCLANNTPQATIAPTLCGDGNPCTADQCNGAGGCQHPLQPVGFFCGSTLGNDCTLPDTCNSTGACLPNNMPAGMIAPTLCYDGNGCTRDVCDGSGGCMHPPEPTTMRCDDGDACGPDSCDGAGNFSETASTCGDGIANCGEQCDRNDHGSCGATAGCTASCTCCPNLTLTTVSMSGSCGRINNDQSGTGRDLRPFALTDAFLHCNTMYLGGGSSRADLIPLPAGVSSVFHVTSCGTQTAMPLGASTAAETGDVGRCTAPGCSFGAPVPMQNTLRSNLNGCYVTTIAPSPAVSGTLNATTGTLDVTLPLRVAVYLNGDLDSGTPGVQECPTCSSGVCRGGPNNGRSCTVDSSTGTSVDCPPPGTPAATLSVTLTRQTTSTSTVADSRGAFCLPSPAQGLLGQATRGAFRGRTGTARYIEVRGSAFGDLRDGQLHTGIAGGTACVSGTGNSTVDSGMNLPGPAGLSMGLQAQLR